MTAATISTIGLALKAQLDTLGPSPGNATFALTQWFSGEFSQAGVDEETVGLDPAAFLAWEGEDPTQALEVRTLAGGQEQLVARATWRVYLVVQDPRGEDTAVPRLLALVAPVLAVLAGFPIAGLYGVDRVEYLGARASLIRRGAAYVYALRFATPYVVAQYEIPDTSVALERVDLDLNLIEPDRAEGDQYDGNPIETLRTDL